jgi:hypothetical protein
MKRIILSTVVTIFMFFSNITTTLNQPEIISANEVIPANSFFEEKVSNDLARFNDTKVVYDGLVTSSIMLAGTTRLFLNIYDNNFNLDNQYIFSSLDYPELVSNVVLVQSKPIRIGNKVYVFFHHEYDLGDNIAFRNQLLEVDISTSNPTIKSYTFELPNSDVAFSSGSRIELDYIDNEIYMMVASSISNFSAFIINLGSDVGIGGFYPSTTSAIFNSTMTNNFTNLKSVNEASTLGICYRFDEVVICKDKNIENDYYLLNLPNNFTTNVLVFNQKNIASRTSVIDGDNTTDVVVYYEIRKNENNNGLELVLINTLDLSYAIGGSRNSETIFPHINRTNNEFKLWSIATSYSLNYQTNTLTLNGFEPAVYEDVFYNSYGQKIMVSKQGDLIRANSDFYSLTFVIFLPNHNVLAYNYYEDDLLIFAFDNVQNRYAYYSYPIHPSSGGSSIVEEFVITEDELRASLAFTYELDVYSVQIQIDQVIFFKNVVYMLDVNILSGGAATSKINLIQILPQGNGKRIDSLFYNFTGQYNISYTMPNTFDHWHRRGSYYLSFNGGLLNGEIVNISLYIGTEEIMVSDTFASPKFIYYFNNPDANISNSELDYNGTIQLSYLTDSEIVRSLYLNVASLTIFDPINSLDYFVFPIPFQLLESYTRGTYSNLYTDFDYFFPVDSIFKRIDEHNNLILKDRYNNIFTLYSLNFLKLNNPGLISINNEFLDIEANSFDLAVSANISSIELNVKPFFKPVLVTNSSPFSLNEGQNVITVTLESLDNSINSITFNIFRAPTFQPSPPITLPGIDPNYNPSSSSSSSTSSISSSVISSSVSSSITPESSSNSSLISGSSSSSSNISSSIGSINDDNPSSEQENPLFILILLLIPASVTAFLLTYGKLVKGKTKLKKQVNRENEQDKKSNSKNKDNL